MDSSLLKCVYTHQHAQKIMFQSAVDGTAQIQADALM